MFSKIEMGESLLPCSSVNRTEIVVDIDEFRLLLLNLQKEWESSGKVPFLLISPPTVIKSH